MTILTTDSSPTSDSNDPQAITLDSIAGKKQADKIVKWADGEYTKIKGARSRLEKQWYINLAFYSGRQNISILPMSQSVTSSGFRLVTPPAPYWRSRPVVNKIRPMIRTELAKVTSQKPSAFVIPASSDDKDLFAAQAGEEVWDSFYRRKNVRQVLRKATFWTLITGTGFIKDYWDASAIDNDSDQLGDICVEHVTPYHLFIPDFMEQEMEGQPYVIHATTKSPDWIKARYSKTLDGKDVKPNVSSSSDILEDSFIKLVGAEQVVKNSVLMKEVWIQAGANAMFPNGAMLTIIGDQLVQATEGNPYEYGQYPFTKFEHIPTGRFYCESTITDIIPLQKEYNRTRGQIIEAKNIMAKPQLLAAQGSIDPSKITTEPGQVILYKQGFTPPTPLRLEPLPAYVLQELDRIQRDIDDISGQHEVSKGQTPAGVSAATAIAYLQEQDDTKLSHTIDSIEAGMEKVATHVLSHAIQYWDVPRIIKVVGTDSSFDAMELKGSDISSDIKMEAGSALPTSRAAKQAFILDLMKMGFIDPNKGLEVMEMGGINKLYEAVQIDTRQAQRENLRMQTIDEESMMQHLEENPGQTDPATGQPATDPMTGQPLPVTPIVPVNTWDEHGVHIMVHNKFRKSQAFDLADPAVKQAFEQHVQMHIAAMGAGIGAPPGQPGRPPLGNPGGPPPPGVPSGNGPGGPPPPTNGTQPQMPPPPGNPDLTPPGPTM